jgi:hypothetical protein
VLGYPIRKPPDQRSVANSPGHIAGSHVLHRLLMPRHPPCALKNLNTTTTRCSRSLCSSQNTNGHHPTPPPTPNPTEKPCENIRCGMRAGPARTPEPHPPTRQRRFSAAEDTKQPGHPVRGFLVARFLRTQQCARPIRTRPVMVFLNPPQVTGSTHIPEPARKRSNSQCSTYEPTRRRDVRPPHASWTSPRAQAIR